MLGGQHLRRCIRVSDGVYKAGEIHRTHAYLIRSSATNSLLKVWYACTHHCDWAMAKWQRDEATYCPRPFLFGQGGGQSDISGNINGTQYW